MKIQKALRELSIENCEVIGTGGHGQVLRINGDTIVKLFHPGTPIEDAEREQEYAKRALIMGLPAEMVDKLWGIFISVYLNTKDPQVIYLLFTASLDSIIFLYHLSQGLSVNDN